MTIGSVAFVISQAQHKTGRCAQHADLRVPHTPRKTEIAGAGLLQQLPAHVQCQDSVENELALRFELEVGTTEKRGSLPLDSSDNLLVRAGRTQPPGKLLVGNIDKFVAPDLFGHTRPVLLGFPAILLLLDEPTNHLDLLATDWLEKFLLTFEGAAVLISHDRFLLDKIASKIIEVENKGAKVWSGNYSNYIQTKDTLRLEKQRQYVQRKEFVERTIDFIARNKDQEGMRKTARGRKTRLKRLLKENPDFLDKPVDSKTISFGFSETSGKSELVLRCENLSMRFDNMKLFENVTFDVLRGERLGITGPNGTGKSTFLKLALRQLAPAGGTIKLGENLKIGYLDQQGFVLDPNKTVLEELQSIAPQLSQQQLRGMLGAFLLSGDDAFKKTSELSGGQQARLILCKLVLDNPDCLVLDEPTNHLDIASRAALEDAIDGFDGSVIVVSHDRFFLDRIADKLFVVGSDKYGKKSLGSTEFVSGRPVYSKYAQLIYKRLAEYQQQKQQEFAKFEPKRNAGRPKKETKTKPEEIKRFNKYTVEQIEEMIINLEKKIMEMKERFGNPEIYKNPSLLMQLQKEFDTANAELELLYKAYEWRAD